MSEQPYNATRNTLEAFASEHRLEVVQILKRQVDQYVFAEEIQCDFFQAVINELVGEVSEMSFLAGAEWLAERMLRAGSR